MRRVDWKIWKKYTSNLAGLVGLTWEGRGAFASYWGSTVGASCQKSAMFSYARPWGS